MSNGAESAACESPNAHMNGGQPFAEEAQWRWHSRKWEMQLITTPNLIPATRDAFGRKEERSYQGFGGVSGGVKAAS